MKLLFFILINLLCSIVTAQQIYFNKRIDYNGGEEQGASIVNFNDTDLILSGTINPTIKLALSFLDSNGNLIQTKIYGDIYHNRFIGSGNDLISTKDGGYAYVGSIDDSTGNVNIIFYKFNSLGDTEWTRIYGDTTYQSGWQVKQTMDGGFIITGSSGTRDTMDDVCLLKIDSIGNIKWWGYYGGTDNDVGLSVTQTTDGGYFISGFTFSYGPNAFSTFDNCYVVKTDSLGNMEWDRVFGGQYGEGFWGCIETRDSGLLAIGVYTNYDPYQHCCFSIAWPYFVKLDFNGNIIWERKIGKPLLNTGVSSVRELNDGSIIACGAIHDTINFKTKGLIIKLSQQGDSLWYKMYEATAGPHSTCYFNDITPTDDGGFLAIGFVAIASPDTGNQDTWILKVDSNGCEVMNCIVNSVGEIVTNSNEAVNVFPNPSQNIFHFKLPDEGDEIKKIMVKDVFGEEILISTENEIDLSNISTGIYFYYIKTFNNKIYNGKLLKQ